MSMPTALVVMAVVAPVAAGVRRLRLPEATELHGPVLPARDERGVLGPQGESRRDTDLCRFAVAQTNQTIPFSVILPS